MKAAQICASTIFVAHACICARLRRFPCARQRKFILAQDCRKFTQVFYIYAADCSQEAVGVACVPVKACRVMMPPPLAGWDSQPRRAGRYNFKLVTGVSLLLHYYLL